MFPGHAGRFLYNIFCACHFPFKLLIFFKYVLKVVCLFSLSFESFVVNWLWQWLSLTNNITWNRSSRTKSWLFTLYHVCFNYEYSLIIIKDQMFLFFYIKLCFIISFFKLVWKSLCNCPINTFNVIVSYFVYSFNIGIG